MNYKTHFCTDLMDDRVCVFDKGQMKCCRVSQRCMTLAIARSILHNYVMYVYKAQKLFELI